MGRKPDPRGKDRPRTIVLTGDVAEIAQKLADKGALSSTLSQLLRQSYGIDTEIERLEHALNESIDQRKALQRQEEELIAKLEIAKDELVQKQNHILPSLYQRQGIIEERLKRLQGEASRAFEPAMISRKNALIDENMRLLDAILDEIRDLEGKS